MSQDELGYMLVGAALGIALTLVALVVRSFLRGQGENWRRRARAASYPANPIPKKVRVRSARFPAPWGSRKGGVGAQQQRLGRMALNNREVMEHLMNLEISRGARGFEQAAEWAADRLERERSR